MAWFLIIAATLFPKYLLWKRVQNHKKYFFYITLLYSRYSMQRVEEVVNMEDCWRADSNLQDSLLKSQSWIQDWKSWWQWWITYYVQGLESSYFRPTLSLCQPHNPILSLAFAPLLFKFFSSFFSSFFHSIFYLVFFRLLNCASFSAQSLFLPNPKSFMLSFWQSYFIT